MLCFVIKKGLPPVTGLFLTQNPAKICNIFSLIVSEFCVGGMFVHIDKKRVIDGFMRQT